MNRIEIIRPTPLISDRCQNRSKTKIKKKFKVKPQTTFQENLKNALCTSTKKLRSDAEDHSTNERTHNKRNKRSKLACSQEALQWQLLPSSAAKSSPVAARLRNDCTRMYITLTYSNTLQHNYAYTHLLFYFPREVKIKTQLLIPTAIIITPTTYSCRTCCCISSQLRSA